jgi:hypothetical protein
LVPLLGAQVSLLVVVEDLLSLVEEVVELLPSLEVEASL